MSTLESKLDGLDDVSNSEELVGWMKEFDDSEEVPTRFSSDWVRVVEGDKEALTLSDFMEFDCTACGSCCRSFSKTVMLDSYDVFLLSRSPALVEGGGEASTQGVWDVWADRLEYRGGVFQADEWGEGGTAELPARSEDGLAPVIFLRPQSARGKQAEEVCGFAAPMGTGTSLRCTLGPTHMPATCALYPVGELVTLPARTDNGQSREFFTVDTAGCEGVRSIKAEGKTVGEYRDSHDLQYRTRQWEWFKEMATATARMDLHRRVNRGWPLLGALSLEVESVPASNLVAAIDARLFTLWYNFDAADELTGLGRPVDPVDGSKGASRLESSWDDVSGAVRVATIEYVQGVDAALTRMEELLRDDFADVTIPRSRKARRERRMLLRHGNRERVDRVMEVAEALVEAVHGPDSPDQSDRTVVSE